MKPHETFEALLSLREDLALALRAAAAQGLSEGVCNHFSVAVPGQEDWFLLNPRGLHWSEVQAADIVMCHAQGDQLAGRHPVEPTAMFIHAAVHRIAPAEADVVGLGDGSPFTVHAERRDDMVHVLMGAEIQEQGRVAL